MQSGTCTFDIRGNVANVSPYLTVDKQGDMLILEFLCGAILPLLVKRTWFGRYDLYIMKEKVLSIWDASTPIDIVFSDFDCSKVTYDIFGGKCLVRGRVILGDRVVASEHVFLEKDIFAWVAEQGVVLSKSCVYTVDDKVAERGCGIRKSKSGYLVTLPNGFRFPMLVSGEVLKVIGVPIKCIFVNFLLISIHVIHFDDSHARFRIELFDSGYLRVFEDVVYDKTGLRCSDAFLSSSQITKMLVLSYEE